jgi:protein-S-isoprenylcysteine O-methyltransferase Ste14
MGELFYNEPPAAAPWLQQLGHRLFPLRGHLPVPFLLLSLCLCSPCKLPTPVVWLGGVVLAVGLAFRVWGVAAWYTPRNSAAEYERLLTDDGPYAYTRNPRYLGNLLQGVGACLLAGLPWNAALYALLWAAVHIPIVAAEEAFLAQRFGAVFHHYQRSVNRWWGWAPERPPLWRQIKGLDWWMGFGDECRTQAGWFSLGCLACAWRNCKLGAPAGEQWIFLWLGLAAWLLAESLGRATAPRRHAWRRHNERLRRAE